MPAKGYKLSDEARARISIANLGNKYCLGRRLSAETREKMRQRRLAYNAKNPGYMAELGAIAAKKNRRLSPGERAARERLYCTMKQLTRRVLTMARKSKACTTEAFLGYDKARLRQHLEAQFTPGMSLAIAGSFHVDHHIPFKVFVDRGITDPRVINALWNLRVLSPDANRAKGARYDATRFDADFAELAVSMESSR